MALLLPVQSGFRTVALSPFMNMDGSVDSEDFFVAPPPTFVWIIEALSVLLIDTDGGMRWSFDTFGMQAELTNGIQLIVEKEGHCTKTRLNR